MKGYFAFPPPSSISSTPSQPLNAESAGECATWNDNTDTGNTAQVQATEVAKQKRREHERELRERSEIEWVRAGGVLRDAFGRRDKARTERIRQELDLQEVEKQRMDRWEAYEARWRAIQSSTGPITFVEFPWLLGERVACRGLGLLTRRAVSEFLFESLAVRTNTTTRRERIRGALLRWHPDKISAMLARVVPADLELVREGVHVVFSILKTLQDVERTGVL